MSGDEAAQEPALACPACATPVDARQEYCLECGLRLPREEPRRLAADDDGEPERTWSGWALPAVVALAVAALGATLGVAVSDAGGSETAVSTATGGLLTATDAGETFTAPEPPGTAGTVAPPATSPPAPTAPPRVPAAVTWPIGKRGWTIVLLSVPQSEGRAAAEARAAEARRRGLRRVGVLNSSRVASLHPGYFVVFTGVFESQAEAVGALRRPRAVFRGAYQREIVP